ncbi:hypothetical protein BDV3_004523 [Batrachochytrium dendrobatidis]|nr:hypothetical protein O5D80_006464 [Batrachochytrium dendrobatidis]KAK5672724.1 hypothetical protein QVD99_000226 [Batrachochytrium dendrobatidis]
MDSSGDYSTTGLDSLLDRSNAFDTVVTSRVSPVSLVSLVSLPSMSISSNHPLPITLLTSTDYEYVDSVNINLTCPICCHPFVNPVTSLCDHTFCLDCISTAVLSAPVSPTDSVPLDRTSFCPIDRRTLCLDDMLPTSMIVANMVNELQTFCIHKSKLCSWKGERQSLLSHLENACPFTLVPCLLDGCQSNVPRKELDSHISQCEYRPFNCTFCNQSMRFCDQESHRHTCPFQQKVDCPDCGITYARSNSDIHNKTCERASVFCRLKKFGCPWQGPRIDLETLHLSICPYVAIEGYLVFSENKFNTLIQANQQLRQDMSQTVLKIDTLAQQLAELQNNIAETIQSPLPGASLQNSDQPPQLQLQLDDSSILRVLMEEMGFDMHRIKIELDSINGDMTSRIGNQIAPIMNETHHLRAELIKTQATCQSISTELMRLVADRRNFGSDAHNLIGGETASGSGSNQNSPSSSQARESPARSRFDTNTKL